jgi:hypothetical protein
VRLSKLSVQQHVTHARTASILIQGFANVWPHPPLQGGVSKATRTLHVSEDVFSGMAHMLRGGRNAYVNHSFVGKGRDMGLDSILG